MTDQDGDSTPTHSDQEDLMQGSDLEDLTDLDEIQFTYAKSPNEKQSEPSEPVEWKPKLYFIAAGLTLFFSSFTVIILFPLYWQQLQINSQDVNIFSGLLFVSIISTILIWIIAMLSSWVCKWDVGVLSPPIGLKRMLMIGMSFGVGGVLVFIAGSKIPCHLQDPLKAITMLFSLVFYFFLCRKVMGLQRIFSATTTVVGLFISVDYGLCDEFRCRGYDDAVSNPTTTQLHNSPTWQQRVIWTFVYVFGLALWTFHLTILESHILTTSISIANLPLPPTLLSTVSRLVSHSEPLLPLQDPYPRASTQKKRPRVIHITAWVHVISLFCILLFSWVDYIPAKGSFPTVAEFWNKTHNGLYCHFEVPGQTTQLAKHLAYLSNLTPHGAVYNRTLENIRKRRTVSPDEEKNIRLFQMNYDDYLQKAELRHRSIKQKHWVNNAEKKTPVKVSILVNKIKDNCELVRVYGWIFTLAYIIFAISLIGFLVLSESAVFTVAVVTAAIPFAGIYWAVFKLVLRDGMAYVLWSPAVTGELICSLLGLPLVVLGVVFLCRAQFRDFKQSDYSSLENRVA